VAPAYRLGASGQALWVRHETDATLRLPVPRSQTTIRARATIPMSHHMPTRRAARIACQIPP